MQPTTDPPNGQPSSATESFLQSDALDEIDALSEPEQALIDGVNTHANRQTESLLSRYAKEFSKFHAVARLTSTDPARQSGAGAKLHQLALSTRAFDVFMWCAISDTGDHDPLTIFTTGNDGRLTAFPVPDAKLRRLSKCQCAGQIVGEVGSEVQLDLCGEV